VERTIFLAGVRRFFVVLGMLAGGTAIASSIGGVLLRADLARSLAIGFYVVGASLLIGGFFVGNRGPVRAKRNQPIPIFGTRFVRWATAEEQYESINTSAVYVSLGFALILVGVLADTV
jgi:uncharacterized membrane protein HdeD (DUF308 family)